MLARDKLTHKAGPRLRMQTAGWTQISESIGCFLLAAVLSGAGLPGEYAPLGVSLVGAAGMGWNGLSGLLGAIFGALCFQGPRLGLRDAAAAILVFSVGFAYCDSSVYRRVWFMPAVTGLMVGITGFVSLRAEAVSPAGLACFLTAILLSGGAVYFDRIALSVREWHKGEEWSRRQAVALLLFGGTLLMSLTRVTVLGGLSVGRMLAALVILCAGAAGGVAGGAVAGLCAGLAMDLAAGTVLCCVAFGAGGLFAGIFSRQGRLPGVMAFLLADGICGLWLWDRNALAGELFFEVLLAAAVFLGLPERFFRLVSLRLDPPGKKESDRRKVYVQEKLNAAAGAFRAVHESLQEAFAPERDNPEDVTGIIRRACDRVCVRCVLREQCWQKEFQATMDAMNHGMTPMLARGKGLKEDFPAWFAGRCIRLEELLRGINEELATLLYQRRFGSRLRESRGAVCSQYAELSRVLGDAALELSRELIPEPVRERRLKRYLAGRELEGECAVFYDERARLRAEILVRDGEVLGGEESRKDLSRLLGVELRPAVKSPERGKTRIVYTQSEPLAAFAGVAAQKKDGETVSGDAGAWFKGEDGVLWLLLCDGMGSGQAAGRESDLAIRLLEKFLRAGVPPEAALRTLNSALFLRGEAQGGFTTVDLCRLDLFTGEGTVYKYGAAPTYLRKSGTVVKISSTALPAGLAEGERVEADATPFHLEPGDWAMLVTDGVTDGEEDGWLRELFSREEPGSPKELARQVLEQSGAHAAVSDDRTVLVFRVERR